MQFIIKQQDGFNKTTLSDMTGIRYTDLNNAFKQRNFKTLSKSEKLKLKLAIQKCADEAIKLIEL